MTEEEEAIFWDERRNRPRRKLRTLAANADKVGNLLARNPRFAIFAIIS